jgi:hypothetical protein
MMFMIPMPPTRSEMPATILRNVVSARIPRVHSVEEMLRAGDRVLAWITPLRGRTIVEVSGASG